MKKYKMTASELVFYEVVVEANNEDEAYDKAYDKIAEVSLINTDNYIVDTDGFETIDLKEITEWVK